MAREWKESHERTFRLPCADPKAFALCVHWLYFGTLRVLCDEPGLVLIITILLQFVSFLSWPTSARVAFLTTPLSQPFHRIVQVEVILFVISSRNYLF